MAEKVTIQDLMECGVHFGHQVKRWNPKMKDFVYGVRNGIHIIDLTKTMHQLADACNFLQGIIYNGGDILFVGTKRQAQEIVRKAAEDTGMYYVSERWLGGALTNHETIRKSITRMRTIDKAIEKKADSMSKKELASFNRKSEKLHRNLDGISEMRKQPAALVIVDICKEHIAVKEAHKLNIPVVAIVDTNGNPEEVDYPIPGNDDAIRSIRVMTSVVSNAVSVAAELYRKKAADEKAQREKQRAEEAEKAKKLKEEKIAKKKAEAKEKAEMKKAKASPPEKEGPKPKTAKDEKPAAPKKEVKAEKKEDKKPTPPKAAKPEEKKAKPAQKKEEPKEKTTPKASKEEKEAIEF